MRDPANTTQAQFSDEVREIANDIDYGIWHNGNDHSQGPLSNCPRCVAHGLIAEIDVLRSANAELSRRLTAAQQALARIADENDALLGIGSEMEFAQLALNDLGGRAVLEEEHLEARPITNRSERAGGGSQWGT